MLTDIKCFKDRAVECYKPVEVMNLVKMCLSRMHEDYKVLLANSYPPTFSTLLECARNIVDSVRTPSGGPR